jgi:hypothetical protein
MVHKSPTRQNQAEIECLVLSLNADRPQKQEGHGTLPTLPPIVMTWSISGSDGWRDWDCKKDELSNSGHAISTLRGAFVDPEKRFCVPIRSGLDWTRKAFLSCA